MLAIRSVVPATLFLLMALASWLLPGLARAELRVDVTPAAVTAPDQALVIMEASSLHWAANLIYLDVVERRTVHVRYAAGLGAVEAQGAFFDAAFTVSGDEAYLTDKSQSLLRIAQGVRLRDYRLSNDAADRFPSPAVQYTVRMGTKDARALRLMWEAHAATWGQRFSVDGYNALGRLVFSEALRHTRIRQVSSNQVLPWESVGVFSTASARPEDLEGIPNLAEAPQVPVHDIDGGRHATPMAFLYAAMLAGERSYEEARTPDSVVGSAGLAGCTLPDTFSVSQSALDATDADELVANIASLAQKGSASDPYLILMKRAQGLDRDANSLLAFALNRLLPGSVNPFAGQAGTVAFDILLDGKAVLDQALWENPEVIEAFVLGHVDPATIPVWRCMALRAARGVVEPTRSTTARNVGYAEIDATLGARSWRAMLRGGPVEIPGAPRFFAAAHNVTRFFGVGLVDAIELYGSPEAYLDAFAPVAFDSACTGWGKPLPALIPAEGERQFLRDINFDLYHNINLPVVGELMRSGVLFDPISWGPLSHRTPAGAAMAFDLRMVLAEQGRIEERIVGAISSGAYGLDDPAAWDRMSNSQIALYCSRLVDIARFANPDPEAQFQIIGGLKTMLDALVRDGIVPLEESGFRSYLWRVATGSAYVHLLHGASQEDFVTYMERLRAEMAAVRGRSSPLAPAVQQELAALADRRHDRNAESERRWTEALATYLHPTSEALRLFGCDAMPPSVELSVSEVAGPLLTRGKRIDALAGGGGSAGVSMDGLGPVAIAFDLSASGDGALLPNARIAGTAGDAVASCQAISSRRKALEGMMTVVGSAMAFLDIATVDRMLVLDRSVMLAETQGRIEPFLVAALREKSGLPNDPEQWKRDDLRRLVERAFVDAANYQRNVAVARRLSLLPNDQFTALSLTMTQEEVGRLGKTAALAAPPADAELKNGEAGRAIEAADALDARIGRVAVHQATLEALRVELCRALDACSRTVGERRDAADGPLRPIPVNYPYPRRTEDEVARGIGMSANLPIGSGLVPNLSTVAGVLEGSGLYYRITPTNTSDATDRPLQEAELVYRLPQPGGAMVAAVTRLEGVTVTDEVPEMEGLSALTQVREIPLGITFTRTFLDVSTGLREVASGADFSLRRSATQMNAAARSLGLANWVEIRGLHARAAPGAEEGIKGLRDITVFLDVALLGAKVPERVPLPLIRDGEFVDPAQALRAALAERVEVAAAEFLGSIVADLGPMRFPADPERFETAHIKFGPSGARAFDIRFDWDSRSLTAGIDYQLVVGETSLRARADLLVDPDGRISVRNARFQDDLPDILPALREVESLAPVIETVEGVAASLTRARVDVEDLAASLQAMPVITADEVAILLRQALTVKVAGQACVLTFQVRLPLDLSDAEEAMATAVQDVLGDQLARCATEVATTKLFASLATFDSQPTIDFFGTKATLAFGDDGALSLDRAAAMLTTSDRLPVQLHIDQSRSDCRAPLDVRVRGGALVRKDAGLRLDVQSLPPEEADKLSRAMACAVDGFLPQAIRSYVEIDRIDVVGGTVLIDATVRGVPFLSDVPFRRISLTDPTAAADGIVEIIEGAALDALGTGLDAGLKEVFGDAPIDLAGIGSFAVNSTRLDRGSARWWIVLDGTLTIESFSFPQTTVRIPVGGSLSDIDVRMPGADDVLAIAVAQAAVTLLPIAPEAPRIRNAFFGPLNATGTLYGLRFDMTAGFPLGDNSIDVEIRQASLSLEGIRLGGEITAALPLPLYFGPVALSKVLLTFVTGEEEGTRQGLKLGADLTAVEPQFARVLKLRSVLDLTEVDRLAFTLTSDVIAFDTVILMAAEGRLDLSNSYASFDASATGVVADIIDPQMTGRLDGKVGLVYARSSLDVFGERITENELELCSTKCETNGTPGEARIRVSQNLLLGKADGGARTDLAFRDPSLAVGVDLNLFGWRPGGAGLAVDLGGAEVNMRFLGIGVKILTPSYHTMDPAFVARVLKDLLKIDLSSLLDIDPADITISLMSASGDVSSSSQNDGTQEGDSEGPGQQPNRTGPPSAPPEEEEQKGGPPRPDEVVPPQETWGTAVKARVCERYLGPPDAGEIAADANHLYFIYGALEDDNDPAWLWTPWQLEVPDWYIWPALGGIAARQLCEVKQPTGGSHRWEIHPEVVSVGAARWILRTNCNSDGSPSVTVRPLNAVSEDPEVRAQFRTAGLPLLCIETAEGDLLVVESQLYVDRRSAEVVLVPLCPPRTRNWAPEGQLGDLFVKLCRTEGAPLNRFALAESGFDFNETVKVITASDELRFFERVVYPQILGTGVPAERGTAWSSYDRSFFATPDEIARGGEVARVIFLIETIGENGELGTARLDRRNADGTPNLLFDLYLRAKDDIDGSMWRPLFLEVFGRFVKTGEAPSFVTTDLATASRIAVRAPELDVSHAYAIQWLWFEETGLKRRLSYLPTRLPTLDGPPPKGLLGYGRDELEALALSHFEQHIAQHGEGPPLRVMFGIAAQQERQQIVVFADPACVASDNDTPGPCPDSVGHASDDVTYKVTLISHRDKRAQLSNWTSPAEPGFTGCITRGRLAEDLAKIMGRAATARDIDDLFFDLANLTGRMPDLTAEPERAFAELRPCP